MTADDYLQEKREEVFSGVQTTAPLSGLCCLRCGRTLLVGMKQCPQCRHVFQWPCPAIEDIPAFGQNQIENRVISQVWQDFRRSQTPRSPQPTADRIVYSNERMLQGHAMDRPSSLRTALHFHYVLAGLGITALIAVICQWIFY